MQIDITRFILIEDPADYAASIAEIGPDAGPMTWAAAMRFAAESDPPMLATQDQLDTFRDDMREHGAWEDAEIDAWTPQECNALLCQRIAGDIREAGLPPSPSDLEWLEYEAAPDNRGTIYRGDDGRVWYYVGS